MAKLALQLLTFHKTDVLPPLFASLASQTDKDWTLYWLDNGSTEEELVKMRAFGTPIENGVNTGFAGGHQKLYELHDADYVLCVNNDVIMEPDYIERLRRYLDEHEKVAAVAGTILRWDFDAEGKVVKSDIIDSLGLGRTRSHKVYDIGSGEQMANGKLQMAKLFGVSGCLPMYRRSAVGEQLFDPNYFLYKEDVDLAYRLNKAGWQAAIVPEAIAYHQRTFRTSILHKDVSFDNQWRSYRNHYRNLRKHLTWKDWLKDGLFIAPFEFAKAWYMLFKYVRHCHRHCLHK